MTEKDRDNTLIALQELIDLYRDRISDLEKRLDEKDKVIVELSELEPIPELTRTRAI